MDSFVSRSLRGIALMTRLRGAETVIVGIQPEVAFAMVQLRLSFEDVQTALDLEEEGAARSPARRGTRWMAAMRSAIAIESDADVVTARQRARALADRLGMPSTDQTLLATAISEIARNITTYAGRGEVVLELVRDARGRRGVTVIARDEGPGIARPRARADRRLHDRRRARARAAGRAPARGRVRAQVGRRAGTVVTMRKWRYRDELARLREERRRRD